MNTAIWKDGHVTDYKPGYAKVVFMPDEIESDWLQIVYPFTMGSKTCWPLKVNTQVKCMMADNMVDGVIIGATYNEEDTPPSSASAHVFVTEFEDGTVLKYNKQSHELEANVQGKVKVMATEMNAQIAGKVIVTATDNIEATSSTKIKGIAPEFEVTAANIKLNGAVVIAGPLTAGSFAIVPAGGANGKVNGNIEIDGNVKATNVEGTNEVKVGSINLSTHKHIGVQTGSGVSGTPTN